MSIKHILRLTCAAIAILLFAACSEDSPKPKPRYDIPMSRSEMEIVETQNEFSFKFFNEAAKINNGNFCISPLSLSMALSMVSNGAVGETKDEILDVLGFETSEMYDVNTLNTRLVKDICAADNLSKLALANSIWIDNSFEVFESFISDNKAAYSAEIFTEALSSQSTMNKINKWCKDKTNGMIPQFLDKPIPQNTLIMLLNALYFKSIWAYPFDKSLTKKANFYNNGENLIQTDMMQTELTCTGAYDSKGANWASIPYGNGAFHMVLILPASLGSGCVENYFSSIDANEFNEMIAGLSKVKLKLKMPKFSIENETNVKQCLQAMGLNKMFDGTGNFSKISEASLIFNAKQKSKIIVDEKGVEATSVTKVSGGITSPGPIQLEKGTLTIDHPFAFFIREVSTGAILFMGRVNNL